MLRPTLTLAFLNQGVAHRAITTASYNNSVVARRPFFDSCRAVLTAASPGQSLGDGVKYIGICGFG